MTNPCSNPAGASKIAGEEDREGEIVKRLGVKVTGYITPVARRGRRRAAGAALNLNRRLGVLIKAWADLPTLHDFL